MQDEVEKHLSPVARRAYAAVFSAVPAEGPENALSEARRSRASSQTGELPVAMSLRANRSRVAISVGCPSSP